MNKLVSVVVSFLKNFVTRKKSSLETHFPEEGGERFPPLLLPAEPLCMFCLQPIEQQIVQWDEEGVPPTLVWFHVDFLDDQSCGAAAPDPETYVEEQQILAQTLGEQGG